MTESADNALAIAKHEKKSEDHNEKIDKEISEIFQQRTNAAGHERAEFFRGLLQLTLDIDGLHGSGQTIAEPGFGVGGKALVRTLAVDDECGLQTRGGLKALTRGVKEHEQGRYDEQKRDCQGTYEGRAFGRHALQESLVKRVKEDGQHGGPGQGNEERLENSEDEIAEQQQGAVGQHRGQTVTGGLLGERSVAHARYIIRECSVPG